MLENLKLNNLTHVLVKKNYLLIILILITTSLLAEDKLGGQEIIERLDKTITINEGLTKARLSIMKGTHETNFWKVNIFKQGEYVLFTFEVTHRKPVAKLLSIKNGQEIYYYNVFSGLVFKIEQMERMKNVFNSAFFFQDLSQYLYEANYNPAEINRTNSDASGVITIKMVPISFPSYKYLQLHADKLDYSPKRIDFTSSDGLLIKTLKFKYGKIKLRENNYSSEIQGLAKLEMTDNATGFVSILEFKEWDKDIKPDKTIYEMKTMYEK